MNCSTGSIAMALKLSSSDLNDFITPSQACTKPVPAPTGKEKVVVLNAFLRFQLAKILIGNPVCKFEI